MPDDALLTADELAALDADLFEGVRGLAGLVSGPNGVDDLLARVSQFAVQAIPGVTGAGITLMRADSHRPRVQSWAVSAPFVRDVDEIQYDLAGKGPCISAMQTRRVAVSGSLDSDPRWPAFGPKVAALGVYSALSLPLLLDHGVVGAINAYAHEPDAFGEQSVRLGEQFARPAAAAVYNAQLLAGATERAERLQLALGTRAVIDQAIGILRSRSGGTAEQAFTRLRQVSQAENVKVSVIAQRMVDDAVRRVRARPVRPSTQDVPG